MSELLSAKQLRDASVQAGILDLAQRCTPHQRERLESILSRAPWYTSLDKMPFDQLDTTYELIRRTVISNEGSKPPDAMTADPLGVAVAALREIANDDATHYGRGDAGDLADIAREALAAIDALDTRCKQCKGKGKLYGAQYGQSRPGYRTIDCDACGGTGKRADAALSAPAAVGDGAIEAWNRRPASAQQREGFVLVPAEPTEAMIHAASITSGMQEVEAVIGLRYARTGEDMKWGERGEQAPLVQAYKAMLATAPTPPPERAPCSD